MTHHTIEDEETARALLNVHSIAQKFLQENSKSAANEEMQPVVDKMNGQVRRTVALKPVTKPFQDKQGGVFEYPVAFQEDPSNAIVKSLLRVANPESNQNGKRPAAVMVENRDHFYTKRPAKIPRATVDKKVFSDYFLASKNRYKTRITKFVRHAQLGGEVAETSISEDSVAGSQADAGRLQQYANKSKFSFKQDGIVSVSQVIDIFCQGLFEETLNSSRKRMQSAGIPVQQDSQLVPTAEDVKAALQSLGWGHVECK